MSGSVTSKGHLGNYAVAIEPKPGEQPIIVHSRLYPTRETALEALARDARAPWLVVINVVTP